MKSIPIIGLMLVLLVGCNHPEVPYIPSVPVINPEDPTVQITINGKLITQSMSWYTAPDSSGFLVNFDKRDYPNATSIRFVANFETTDPINYVHVRLFNLSQHVAVSGTEMRHNNLELYAESSGNILNMLPNAPVTLAIQIKSELGVEVATGWRSYLIIEE